MRLHDFYPIIVTDPAGVWIDVVQQIEPAAGFWERYPPAL